MRRLIPGGLLVAVEGIDGAGKTSLSTLLAQWCGERGIGCMISKEPTGMRWGRELRRTAQEGRLTLDEELRLFELDRRDHVQNAIGPALAENNVVILDRYYWSTAAYQGARGADVAEILRINESFAPPPDLVLLMDLTAEEGLARIRLRGDKPNLFETADALNRARTLFLRQAENSSVARIVDAGAGMRDCFNAALAIFQRAYLEKAALAKPSSETLLLLAEFLGVERLEDFYAGDGGAMPEALRGPASPELS